MMEVTKQATIGPDSWKVASVRNIRLAQTVVQRSDKFNDLGRQLDPLPSLRDSCIQQSNAQIHSYVRETRSVVVKLKYCLLETEEEIKSLLRGKENLEKAHEHIRKDILLNNNSHMRRQARPVRERVRTLQLYKSGIFTYRLGEVTHSPQSKKNISVSSIPMGKNLEPLSVRPEKRRFRNLAFCFTR